MSTIWQTININRKTLNADIFSLLDAAGACDWLGKKHDPILLKPNLVVSKPASGGATTHPEIVAGIIEYLLVHGFTDIAVAEGSWVGDSTAKAFKVCGYTALADHYGIKLIDLQKDPPVMVNTNGEELQVCRSIAELGQKGGSLINLPVLKGHGQTHLTCALKNLKGCIPDTEKRRYHSLGVHGPVALLNTVIKPSFTLVDGLNGDPYWEEGGSPEKRDLLLLGRDSVSLDTHAARLINIAPSDVNYIGMSESFGVGSTATTESDVINLNDAVGNHNHLTPNADTVELREWINSVVDQRSACSACFGNLSGALRKLHTGRCKGIEKLGPVGICIGQDFITENFPPARIGVGVCTKNAQHHLKGCPPSQTAIENFLTTLLKG